MKKQTKITGARKEMGLYDSRTGKSILSYKMVDATNICPGSNQCIIKYGNAVRGKIAQICDWYQRSKDLGTILHYHINVMTPDSLTEDSVFSRTARVMCVEPLVLAKFIFDNQ